MKQTQLLGYRVSPTVCGRFVTVRTTNENGVVDGFVDVSHPQSFSKTLDYPAADRETDAHLVGQVTSKLRSSKEIKTNEVVFLFHLPKNNRAADFVVYNGVDVTPIFFSQPLDISRPEK